jgi:hypothetical protein
MPQWGRILPLSSSPAICCVCALLGSAGGLSGILGATGSDEVRRVLVEAEGFASTGRWVSGWNNGTRVEAPISRFKLQYHSGGTWQDALPEVVGNSQPAWAATFPSLKTNQLRLVISATPENASRVWEVEFYQPLTDPPQ